MYIFVSGDRREDITQSSTIPATDLKYMNLCTCAYDPHYELYV